MAPAVVVHYDDGHMEHWSDFRLDRLRALTQQAAA